MLVAVDGLLAEIYGRGYRQPRASRRSPKRLTAALRPASRSSAGNQVAPISLDEGSGALGTGANHFGGHLLGETKKGGGGVGGGAGNFSVNEVLAKEARSFGAVL